MNGWNPGLSVNFDKFNCSWIRIRISNIDPDPGEPDQCGSMRIWIRSTVVRTGSAVHSLCFLVKNSVQESSTSMNKQALILTMREVLFRVGTARPSHKTHPSLVIRIRVQKTEWVSPCRACSAW